MKKIFTFLLALLLIQPVLALNLTIVKQSSGEVMISEFQNEVIFELEVTNNGPSEEIKFYNLVGLDMTPSDKIKIKENETKHIQVTIKPISNFTYIGYYTFEYFIKGINETLKEQLTFKSIPLKEAFEVGADEIYPESNSIQIYLLNKINFDFGNIKVKFNSPFFEKKKEFILNKYDKKEFSLELNKEDFKKLTAGSYPLNVSIETNNKKANIQGVINFLEKDIIRTEKENYGLLINSEIIRKSNEGNTIYQSNITIKKNIISRLFTNFNPEPNIVERKGLIVNYIWEETINPGEDLEIVIRTNWLLPFIMIFFIITIVILAKQFTRTNLVLRKKVSFVKTKGGEFALKVSIIIKAKKYVENINITDKLPPLVRLYEKFSRDPPARIDKSKRKLEWSFLKLEAGEIRIISYIVYSKLGIVGRFVLPRATAIYEKEGEVKESQSNRVFFVAEQEGEKIKE